MKKVQYLLILSVIMMLFLLTACSRLSTMLNVGSLDPNRDNAANTSTEDFDIYDSAANELPLNDNKSFYDLPNGHKLRALYITVYFGKNKEDGNIFALSDVNNTSDNAGSTPFVDVIMREGPFNEGPQSGFFGFTESQPNAKMYLYGSPSASQKSYKLKLYDRAGLWNGLNTINLDKCARDPSRLKLKFANDMLVQVPDIAGLKTVFVRVYLRDLTKEPSDQYYVDYGLYTATEQPNKRFLENHSLSSEGTILEAKAFNFSADSRILAASTENYDKTAFEELLEIRQGNDEGRIAQVVAELNTGDFDTVFNTYFNRQNYLTFLAFNILTGNYRQANNNYLLYSPNNSVKWFFIPIGLDRIWEDDAGKGTSKPMPVSLCAGGYLFENVVHRKFLSNPENLKQLDQKIEELNRILTSESNITMLSSYQKTVSSSVFSLPDLVYLPIRADDWNNYTVGLPAAIKTNFDKYSDARGCPLPFEISTPEMINDSLVFRWQDAIDLNNENVTYSVIVAKNPEMTTKLHQADNLTGTEYQMPRMLSRGIYYLTVNAVNSSGKIQVPLNSHITEFGDRYPGIVKFEI